MRTFYRICTIIFTLSCSKNERKQIPSKIVEIDSNIAIKSLGNYSKLKHEIQLKKLILLENKNLSDSFLEKEFTSLLVDSIFPYWYGTKWNFNGTTQLPKNGSIACGYFVATTLQDMGLNFQRIKLGKSPSTSIIKAFAKNCDTRLFYKKPLQETIGFFELMGKGVYLIGLDCHVGFVYFDGIKAWFIHSKWFKEKCVIKEEYQTSSIIMASKYRLIAKISCNKDLLKKWLQTKSAL